MQKHRVLYVAKTSTGGSAFSLYRLADGLKGSPYEPLVLLYARRGSYVEERLAESGIQTIALKEQSTAAHTSDSSLQPVRRRDIQGWFRKWFGGWAGQSYALLKATYQFLRQDVPKVWPIVRAIRQHKPALVHINMSLGSAKPGIIAASITGTPCVCHIQVLPKLNTLDKFFARFVSRFIYISEAVAKNYVAQGIAPGKGIVVHHGLDLNEFTPSDDLVRSEFGWTAEERLVGVVGRLDWWKGHEYYLRAMARVVEQVPDLRGLIVGGPESSPRNQEYYRHLLALTHSLGLEDRVIFTGFRSDVARLMSAMDVIVLSSSMPEPFGLVVIEGMAVAKPIVATAAGGALDSVVDGITGLLVPRRDADAMASAILDLVSDPDRARQMGLAGRRRVEQEFTLQRQVTETQRVYDSILAT